MNGGNNWTHKVVSALFTLVLVAYGARLVWELLAPLVSPALGTLVVVALWAWWRGRWNRW